MTWLALAFALELGIVPSSNFLMYDREPQVFEYQGNYYYPVSVEQIEFGPIIYTELDATLWFFDLFFAGGGVRVQTRYSEGSWNFSPQATFYEFVAGWEYRGVRLQYRHACLHPQMTYMYDYRPSGGWEGAYDELGLSFSGRLPLWGGKR